jgi:site-specific recombinase XerD
VTRRLLSRTPGALSRRGRSGTASGRDDRAHMERSRSRRGNVDRSQVVVAGHRGNTQERARLQDSSHETLRVQRAGLRPIGSHILRHTFCSHLAMHGAAPKAIQELAGHSTLALPMRYMPK